MLNPFFVIPASFLQNLSGDLSSIYVNDISKKFLTNRPLEARSHDAN